jgi:hypothetical protein
VPHLPAPSLCRCVNSAKEERVSALIVAYFTGVFKWESVALLGPRSIRRSIYRSERPSARSDAIIRPKRRTIVMASESSC